MRILFSSCQQTRLLNLRALFLLLPVAFSSAAAQTLPPVPAPLNLPAPGASTSEPYAPQAILPGGIVIPLYPANSPFLNAAHAREPEKYNMSQSVPGRINSIVNLHNPSIEVHTVDPSLKYWRGRDSGGGRRSPHSECG